MCVALGKYALSTFIFHLKEMVERWSFWFHLTDYLIEQIARCCGFFIDKMSCPNQDANSYLIIEYLDSAFIKLV